MPIRDGCPICLLPHVQVLGQVPNRDAFVFHCARCGRYTLSGILLASLPHEPESERIKIALWVRQAHAAGAPLDAAPVRGADC